MLYLQPNLIQVEAIQRYHRHLARAGRNMSLETAARQWIGRYSRLWRKHFNRPGTKTISEVSPCSTASPRTT